MRPDSVVRTEGMSVLCEKLGMVDAERFVALLLREPFDYTEWRESIYGSGVKSTPAAPRVFFRHPSSNILGNAQSIATTYCPCLTKKSLAARQTRF